MQTLKYFTLQIALTKKQYAYTQEQVISPSVVACYSYSVNGADKCS